MRTYGKTFLVHGTRTRWHTEKPFLFTEWGQDDIWRNFVHGTRTRRQMKKLFIQGMRMKWHGETFWSGSEDKMTHRKTLFRKLRQDDMENFCFTQIMKKWVTYGETSLRKWLRRYHKKNGRTECQVLESVQVRRTKGHCSYDHWWIIGKTFLHKQVSSTYTCPRIYVHVTTCYYCYSTTERKKKQNLK